MASMWHLSNSLSIGWKIEDGNRGYVHMGWRVTTHNVAILRRDLRLALPRGSKSRSDRKS